MSAAAPVRLISASRREIGGTLRKVRRQQADEFFFVARAQRVVEREFLADGGLAFRPHLLSAKRSGAVGGPDFDVVAQGNQFLMQAVEQHSGELLRSEIGRQIGAADVTGSNSVSPVSTAKGRSARSRSVTVTEMLSTV